MLFLGSGNAFASGGRYWSSFLANGRYLFDAPPTLLPHLKRIGTPLTGNRDVRGLNNGRAARDFGTYRFD